MGIEVHRQSSKAFMVLHSFVWRMKKESERENSHVTFLGNCAIAISLFTTHFYRLKNKSISQRNYLQILKLINNFSPETNPFAKPMQAPSQTCKTWPPPNLETSPSVESQRLFSLQLTHSTQSRLCLPHCYSLLSVTVTLHWLVGCTGCGCT